MGILESCKGRSFRRTHPVSDHSSSSQQLIAPEISEERPKDGNLPALSDPSSSSLNSQQLIAPEISKESPKDENLPALSDPSSSSLNSQQLIAPEISKENPKDENLPAISPTKKEAIVSHGIKNKAYHVLGRKTANFRKLYVLGRELRRELRGSTYLCMEIATEIKYACKFISKKKFKSEEEVEDVRREIHVLHHLAGYKNIVTIKAAYEDPFYVYIVMELCEGGEFFERINQSRRYSEREAAELTKIIVGVVQDCHSLGVMHRDLKPENFLLLDKDDDFSLKAVDFGLAIFFEPGNLTSACACFYFNLYFFR